MSVRFDHLGIVVRDIDEAANLYSEMLGLTPWDRGVVEDSENGVRLLSLPTGNTFIELIQPITSENRFARFLKERGYHFSTPVVTIQPHLTDYHFDLPCVHLSHSLFIIIESIIIVYIIIVNWS